MVTIFIGEDLYDKLPEDEQETFEFCARYKPDALQEQIEYFESKDEEWSDEIFSELEDYEEFAGDDFSEKMMDVYKKEFDSLSEEEIERFEMLSEETKEAELGSQLKFG